MRRQNKSTVTVKPMTEAQKNEFLDFLHKMILTWISEKKKVSAVERLNA
jgi:hypothetical protein